MVKVKPKHFLVYGNSTESLRASVEETVANLLSKNKSKNVLRFDIKSIKYGENSESDFIAFIDEEMMNVGLMQEEKILVIESVESIDAVFSKGDNKKLFLEILTSGLQDESSLNNIIFVHNSKTPKLPGVKFNKAVEQTCNKVKSLIVSDDYRSDRLIREKADKLSLNLSYDSIQFLDQVFGKDIDRVGSELEKLVLIYPDGRTVQPADIHKVISASNDFNIFVFKDALIEKKDSVFRKQLFKLEEQETGSLIPLYVMISNSYLKLLSMKSLMVEGYSESEIESLSKESGWLFKKSLKACDKYTPEELENIVIELSENDLNIKFSESSIALMRFSRICRNILRNRYRMEVFTGRFSTNLVY